MYKKYPKILQYKLCTRAMSVIKGGPHYETALYSIPRLCPKKNPRARTTKNAKNTMNVV